MLSKTIWRSIYIPSTFHTVFYFILFHFACPSTHSPKLSSNLQDLLLADFFASHFTEKNLSNQKISTITTLHLQTSVPIYSFPELWGWQFIWIQLLPFVYLRYYPPCLNDIAPAFSSPPYIIPFPHPHWIVAYKYVSHLKRDPWPPLLCSHLPKTWASNCLLTLVPY